MPSFYEKAIIKQINIFTKPKFLLYLHLDGNKILSYPHFFISPPCVRCGFSKRVEGFTLSFITMKRLFTFLCVCMMFLGARHLKAQDTTIIQTFTYGSTTRAAFFQFPPDTTTYEKILMQYSMRCKNGLISTQSQPNLGCGEWDYSCNTYITDSSLIDSVKATHNNYTISNFSGAMYPYSINATYSYTQYQQQAISYTSTLNENILPLGNGTISANHPLASGTTSGKSQYLWTAAELNAAGLVAGDISGMELDLMALGGSVDFLRVKMKATSNTTINQIDNGAFQQVYFLNTAFAATGYQRLNFYAPFTWDGVSNILVEVNYNNNAPSTANEIRAEAKNNLAVSNYTDDYYVQCDGFDDYIDAGDVDDLDGATQFTYEGWVKISSWRNWVNIFGKNGKTLLQTGDTPGNLYCIVRNPTNDYGYATGVLPLNTWTHVAMVYDATQTGNANRLKMYINGNLITMTYNGTIPATTDVSTASLRIADIAGAVDNARVWKTPLSGATIADYMRRKLDANHPNYADLVLAYEMNEGTGNVLTDLSLNSLNGMLPNGGFWSKFNGNAIFKDLAQMQERPNVNFVQGTYTSTIDTTFVLDSTQNQPNTVITYDVQNNSLMTTDTSTYWLANQSYIRDENGFVLDSLANPADDTLHIAVLNYYNKWLSKLELMSFVTPYGKGLDLGMAGKMWQYDVTDFEPVLHGNKYINIEKGGEWQEDLDIKFLFIKGTPPREVLSMQQIWPVTADAYSQILNNNRYESRNVTLRPDATYFKVRSTISGHGQEGEFIPRTHFFNLNGGSNDFQWTVWKECALNPVYPQGGTWVYDRAGWCPGMATDTKEMDVTALVTPGQTHTMDYGVTTASGDSRYIVNNQLVQYGAANFALDAAIEDVIKPSTMIAYGRNNPVCMKPVVRIKNTGSTALSSLKINYGMQGTTPSVYQWNGNLAFLQTADITLNIANWSNTSGKFEVSVTAPNGGIDMYPNNNSMVSNYVIPAILPTKLIIEFKSNKNPDENAYDVIDENGTTVLSQGGFTQNTLYTDTLLLSPGCYQFRLTDQGNDGLQWWANTAQGAGYCRIKNATTGTIVKNFGPDFGAEIFFQFTADASIPITEYTDVRQTILEVYPNPTSGELFVQANFSSKKEGEMQIIDLNGRSIYQHNFDAKMTENWNVNVSSLAKGMYMIICRSEGEVITEKFMVE
jgi:Concanavalin A-like lectin/glucanases superfamily/Peptide-N-glycosidase F, C terminal/Secretion system C-terminal sorting domain